LIDNKILRSFTYIILFISIESLIIATIALTSQSFDGLLIRFTGRTCGIGIYPDKGWIWVHDLGNLTSPFGDRLMFATFGFLVNIYYNIYC
jgi:hypothetical protein